MMELICAQQMLIAPILMVCFDLKVVSNFFEVVMNAIAMLVSMLFQEIGVVLLVVVRRTNAI